MAFVLVAVSVASAWAGAQNPTLALSSEMALQGCFAGEGSCTTPPVTSSDGRVLIHLVPAFVGEVQVFLHSAHGGGKYLYTCESPPPGAGCSRIVETGKAGTYRVEVVFGPEAQGAVFVEVVTPS